MRLKRIKTVVFTVIILLPCSWAAGVLADQVCKESQRATTPTSDFEIHQDGTVTHKKTGLMWMRCSVGQNWDKKANQCVDDGDSTNDQYDWSGAVVLSNRFSYSGYTDWRIPNIKELASIVELKCFRPSINLDVFPGTYIRGKWLAMPDEKKKYSGWLVYLGYRSDNVDLKKTRGWLRLVRSVPPS